MIHATIYPGSFTSHLDALPGASRATLVFHEADLLDAQAISKAIEGCSAGTLNVLEATKRFGVRRVVLSSSISAMVPNTSWDDDKVLDESSWTDIDYCKSHQSKSGRHLRSRQQLHAIQREIRRENEAHLGTCMRKISRDCKEMLKKKLEEIVLHNNTISPPHSSNISENKYKRYKCFGCFQRGHILKFCPANNKSNGKNADKDSSENTKESEEDVKPANPTVVLRYPESIHFSTTYMIKGTDHGTWDDIWYISNHTDKHLCYKQDFFCNIKEAFTVNKLENQKKFLFTYGIGEVIIEDGGQGCLVPGVYYAPEVTLNILSMDLLEKQGFEIIYEHNRCSLVYMFNNSKKERLDEDRLRTRQNQYLEEYFESLANKDVSMEEDLIRIKGNLYSTKGNGEEIKRCYMNYLDVFTSYFKTARAPQQEYNGGFNQTILKMPTREIEEGKDRDCLMSHQWDFSETGAPTRRTAVQKGKGKVEHFGVKLEDTEEGEDSQEQPTLSHSTRTQNLQGMILGPSTSRITSNEDSGSNTCDDFTIIT
ncbi:ARID DNA-binding domain-containing protein [Tanacetum coccineum]